jgi:hypothetical protein
MSYFDAPRWNDDNTICPHTDERAVPIASAVVKGRRVIHANSAMYRSATFSGTFLLGEEVVLPLPKEGKHRVKVECRWYNHRLKKEVPGFLIDMATAIIEEKYDGNVIANIGKRSV